MVQWSSDAHRLLIGRRFLQRRIHNGIIFWWSFLCAIHRWCSYGMRLPIGWWCALWQSLICNDLVPFVLVVFFFCNGCIIVQNWCILVSFSLLNALMLHFYPLSSRRQAFSDGWRWRTFFCWQILFLSGKQPTLTVILVMIQAAVNLRSGSLSSDTLFTQIGDDG